MTTEKMTGDAYMELLVQRQNAWIAAHPPREGLVTWLQPLLTWFIQPGDEDLVELPEDPPAKPAPTPRTYRSAASLRTERDRLIARRDAIMFDGPADRAAANVATRARWKKLDRDIAAVARLSRRITHLDYRIADADARERR
ncbi:hypothetical protein [Mycobacterium sp. SMC-17]|uniref:hypothetical protein n=1 Tax=Mycobacterium sp. SMC-17 TaxID=3381628 RepID=UPI003876500A